MVLLEFSIVFINSRKFHIFRYTRNLKYTTENLVFTGNFVRKFDSIFCQGQFWNFETMGGAKYNWGWQVKFSYFSHPTSPPFINLNLRFTYFESTYIQTHQIHTKKTLQVTLFCHKKKIYSEMHLYNSSCIYFLKMYLFTEVYIALIPLKNVCSCPC